jgi:hypothetical protein
MPDDDPTHESHSPQNELPVLPPQSGWIRIAKEPLLHFVLIGAAIYLNEMLRMHRVRRGAAEG